jgi:alpha-tubulin suppressor-like RCC1 family protein
MGASHVYGTLRRAAEAVLPLVFPALLLAVQLAVPSHAIASSPPTHIVSLASTGVTSYAVRSDGTLWAWGANDHGQIGDGTTADRAAPVQVGADNDWVSVSASRVEAAAPDESTAPIALKRDGTLWTWGGSAEFGPPADALFWEHYYDQWPRPPIPDYRTPVRVGDTSDWAVVTRSAYHTLAIKTDGSLWVWGANFYGELGDGTGQVYCQFPECIDDTHRWTAVTAGAGFSLAVRSDGTLWAWGDNSVGELGDGTSTAHLTMNQVGTDDHWVAVSAGEAHVIGLKSDGTLWAWGVYSEGGTGVLTPDLSGHTLVPTQIGMDESWTAISAGFQESFALASDGTLWAWGHGYSLTPTQFGSATDWTCVADGSSHVLAAKNDGSLWAWGANDHGQLGDDTTIDRTSPVRVVFRETCFATTTVPANGLFLYTPSIPLATVPPGSDYQVTVEYWPSDEARNPAGSATEDGSFRVLGADTVPPVISGVPSITPVEATGPSGATVSWTAPAAADAVDPHPLVTCSPAPGSVFPIGTTPVTVTATDASQNSSSATFYVIVQDTTAPGISAHVSITVPATVAGGAVVNWSDIHASDAVDGTLLVTCTPASGTFFASGTTTVTMSVTDAHNNFSTGTFSVTVTPLVYNWSGFFQPVDNLPCFNVAKAGRAIPVKFSLGGNMGLQIFASGYPMVVKTTEGTTATEDLVEQTATASVSGLTYDAASGQYTYVWKTDKSLAGTCQTLQLKLADGSVHCANFKFTK